MGNFKKKFKKFVKGKGGLATLISLIATIFLALFLMLIGVIYSDYNGDWSKIPEFLSSNLMITIYVVAGFIIVVLIYIFVLIKRKEDI